MIRRSAHLPVDRYVPPTDALVREQVPAPPATHAELVDAVFGPDAPSLPSADHVVVVGGPGGKEFDADELRCLAGLYAGTVAHCHLVADSGPSASGNILEGLVWTLENQAARQSTLIVLEAHSVLHGDGSLTLTFDEGVDTEIGAFFDAIADARGMADAHGGVPVQLFLACCKGGLALAEAHRLPPGSVVVVLSPGHEDVRSRDFDALTTGFGDRCDTAFGLLQVYCVALKSRIPPSVRMPDGSVLALDEQLGAIQRRKISDPEKALIHQQLDGIDGEARVLNALRFIESGEFIPDSHYGMALAIAAVLGGVTVGASGGIGPLLEPVVHHVLEDVDEPIHDEPAPLPTLNLQSSVVQVLLQRPNGTQVLLSSPHEPQKTVGFYQRKKRSPEGSMSLVSPHGTLQLDLEIDTETEAVRVVKVDGRRRVMAYLCQLGLLNEPAPRVLTTLSDPFLAFFD